MVWSGIKGTVTSLVDEEAINGFSWWAQRIRSCSGFLENLFPGFRLLVEYGGFRLVLRSMTVTIRAVEQAIRQLRGQLEEYPTDKYWYNEMTTRNVIINPMLEALGWDLCNLDQCGYEIDPKVKEWGKKPADYVLWKPGGKAVIVIESKAMDNRLTAGREEEQLAGYAGGLGSGVGVLTNGTNWYIYNLRMRRDFADKLVDEVNLLECRVTEGARTLHRHINAAQWW